MYCKFSHLVYLRYLKILCVSLIPILCVSSLKSLVLILFAVQLLCEMLSFPTVSPLLEIAAPTGEQASWDTHPHPSHVSEESEGFTLNC